MTVHLPEPIERSVNEAVRKGRFPTVDEALAAAWIAFDQPNQGQTRTQPSATPEQAAPAAPSVLAMVDELRKQVPPEEFAKLPTDGARQLDHYLYGTARRKDA